MDNLKIGIVGIGNMGSAHAKSIFLGNIKGLSLGAVCDTAKLKRDWAKENLGDTPIFESYEEMIKSGLIEAVIIATPHYLHPVIAVMAFENGLHVLTEKPAGVFTKQVREMNEAAEKSGKVFGIMYNQRTNPTFAKMREMVQNGELGELKRAVWIITNWYRTQSYYDSGTWRATWDGEGGGVLINQCPHNLDLWQWIFGMPNKIQAKCHYGKWHDIEVEDDVTIYAEYPNGATAAFITTTGDYPGTNRFEITGDLGKLVWEDGKLKFWKLKEHERKVCRESSEGFTSIEYDVIDIQPEGEETAHNGILQNFTNAVLHGEKLLAPGYEGINGLTISNAAHLSDWTEKAVALPIDEELYLKLLNEKRASSKHKTNTEEKIENIAGTYNDRWSVR